VSRDPLTLVRRELRDQLRRRVDARGLATAPPTERRMRVREEAMAVLRERGAILPARELARMVNEISDDVVGFGPIEYLLKDPTVTEVMVNGPDDVFVEREGRIERVPDRLFEGEEPVLHLIERIVGPLGLRVDQASPWVDARLPDGSRVHAIVPPLSLRGPALTIRRFSPVPIEAEDLVRTGSIGPRALRFLAACVRGRTNMVISGGAGSGKTTLLGVLSGFIPDDERLITIEDAAELRLAKPHVVSLEARPANVEGRGEVTVRHLVRNALRMRPDRIIVGEVRGGEALDMLQAMNTGHEGSLSTAHANSSRHLLWRLETMAMMSDVDLPAAHVRSQVAAAIDVVVQLARLRDGRRVVWEIAVVEGTRRGEPVVEPVFRFRPREGGAGRFSASGMIPAIVDILRVRGEDLGDSMFAVGEDAA
jgi:pilus assembly protein CpaF